MFLSVWIFYSRFTSCFSVPSALKLFRLLLRIWGATSRLVQSMGLDLISARLNSGDYADNPCRFANDLRTIRLRCKNDPVMAASAELMCNEFEVLAVVGLHERGPVRACS